MFKPVSAQPNFPEQEEEILHFWQENDIFKKSLEKNKGREPYVIYDGPPTANAKPPLHTMVPMAFKDLVGRYQTMKGRFVPRQAGWDTHGLPVEVQMEKALGLASKKDILSLVPGDENASIRKFNEACRTSVWEFKQDWDKFVPRVGYWADTENPYVTYESSYIEKVWGVFKQVWEKDLVYKGYKVLPYCPRCGTSLSAAEVALEYQDVKDVSVFVTFPLLDNTNRAFLAWTTTPWTLPGNVALAVGKDIEYVVVRQESQEYILAKSRLSILKGEYQIIEEMLGSALVGMAYQPLYPEVIPDEHKVVEADFVTTEDGTGIVHIAPMYGEDDFAVAQKHNLPQVHTVGLDGVYLATILQFAGLYIRDALGPILTSMQEKGRLYEKQSITHSYPFCWRCKTALIYYAKDSWFIAMSKLRKELLEANAKVEWFPEYIKEGRFGDFIKEARDWAISRERFWGTPLPVWISQSGKMLCIGSFDELKHYAKNPELIGNEFDPHRPQVDEIILIKDGEEYLHEPVVMDVWFDSGSMPFASGRVDQGQFPADYIAEAVDQTRCWFYVLMAIGVITRGEAAYKRVVCMGHLVDENGKKMSKSLGNIFDPWETIAWQGADAIRWWVYTVNSPGENKALSEKELQTAFRRGLLLLWNVFNYFVTYANLAEISSFSPPTNPSNILDRWILSRQAAVITQVTNYLDSYDFMRAGRTLENYIQEISTWYLRRSRKRTDPEFFQVMYEIIIQSVIMLAPFIPFLSETMYQVLRQTDMSESVHLQNWPETTSQPDPDLEQEMLDVRQAVEVGMALRAKEKMKVRQPLAKAYLQSPHPIRPELLEILADELNVREVEATGVSQSISIELDLNLTEELIQAGLARDLLRQIQQVRKNLGLAPGEYATLVVGPTERSQVEPLLQAFPGILQDAFIRLDPEKSWLHEGKEEIEFNGQTLLIDLMR